MVRAISWKLYASSCWARLLPTNVKMDIALCSKYSCITHANVPQSIAPWPWMLILLSLEFRPTSATNHKVCDASPVHRHTYGSIPSFEASPPSPHFPTSTKLYCLVTEAGVRKWLSKPGPSSTAQTVRLEHATFPSPVRRSNHSTTEPRTYRVLQEK